MKIPQMVLFDPEKRHLFQKEIPNTMFTPYLYESQGIEIALSGSEIDTVFWNVDKNILTAKIWSGIEWYMEV